MRITSLFTGNPHFLNLFALTTLGIGIPMIYMHYTAPDEDEKERRSVRLKQHRQSMCDLGSTSSLALVSTAQLLQFTLSTRCWENPVPARRF